MIYRRMDPDGDYTFGAGKQNYLVNDEAVAQAIKTKIRLLRGEFWEDLLDGTKLFEDILVSDTSDEAKELIDVEIAERVYAVEDVQEILSFDSSIDKMNRTYSANIRILTIYGTEAEVEI